MLHRAALLKAVSVSEEARVKPPPSLVKDALKDHGSVEVPDRFS